MIKTQHQLSVLLIPLILLMGFEAIPHFSVVTNKNGLPAVRQEQSAAQAQYASLPLAFEPNQGQVDGSAQFLVHHGKAITYFDGANTTTTIGDSRVTISLNGASTPNFTGTDQLKSKTNYFIGNDQSKWHSDVLNFKSLLAKNVYPGIDLKYYGTNSQLEHDFIVSPEADYRQIAFHFDGQENLSLDADGNLVLKAGQSELHLNAPTTYQQTSSPTGESKRTIPSHFELNDQTVSIAINTDYDHSRPLVIDPVLIYSTYLGGTGNESTAGITTDSNGNAYIAGVTDSTDFPTSSPYQGGIAGGTNDMFITKLDPSGSSVIYSTYLGGSGTDSFASFRGNIAVDTDGNVYLTGSTDSADFPTVSPYQGGIAGSNDAFVSKLNAAGSALVYSTYLGGGSIDIGNDITVDSNGNAAVVGYTGSGDFPTASAFQGTGGATSTDAFITKFTADGSTVIFSTYLGGGNTEVGWSIAQDPSNNIYVTGQTASTDLPTSSPLQASSAGGTADTFIAKFTTNGSVIYSTYFGGTGDDYGFGITADSNGDAYLTGYTTSSDFPTATPLQANNNGGYDAFVTKINADGSALTYSTYLGGASNDISYAIAINLNGNAYITGDTDSNDFPTVAPFQATNAGGGGDAFVAKLNTSGGALAYSTFLGGTGYDPGKGITLGLNGNAYIIGNTSSSDFPSASPFQVNNNGGDDIFIAQLSENTVVVTGVTQPALTFILGSTTCDLSVFSATQTKYCTHTIAAASNASGGYVIAYTPTTTLTSGADTITALTSQSSSVLGSEQFGFNLMANTSAGSFTAANFGADPTGGSGTASTGYEVADQFKFSVGGDNIAQTTGTSNLTTFTASYIANTEFMTQAGTYLTPVTYNVVANY